MTSSPEAIWFGPLRKPLAGYLHSPDGPVTGGVLVCAPFGYEATCAHSSLRRLADRLAEQGDLVLRFSYEGTGSSAGSGLESDLLDRWQENVLAGLSELGSRGIERPAVVGLRMGAALAAAAVARGADVGPVVLWAPITSGARYQRELRALSATNPWTVTSDGSMNVAGHVVPAEMSDSLRNWKPFDGVGLESVLLVESPGWRDAAQTIADLTAVGVRSTLLEVEGTAAVLERDAELVVVPEDLIAGIAEWISACQQQRPTLPPRPCGGRTRVFDDAVGEIREELVTVGTAALHGVMTEPLDSSTDRGVVFLNNGVESADGPARAWVNFARLLAAEGVSSLRVDLSGLGNSPDSKDVPPRLVNPTPDTSADDMLAAVSFLRSRGAKDVTVVGLCSGAQIAVRTVAYRGQVDNVVAINAPLGSLRDLGVGPPARKVWRRMAPLTEKRPSRELFNRLPAGLWGILDRLGLFPAPDRYLRRALRRGSRVVLVYAVGDRGLDDLESRAGRRLPKLLASDLLSMKIITGMDHSLFNLEARRTALDIVRQVCLGAETVPVDHS